MEWEELTSEDISKLRKTSDAERIAELEREVKLLTSVVRVMASIALRKE